MKDYNLDKLNSLIKSTGEMIDKNPLLEIGSDVADIQNNFQQIQQAMQEKGSVKKGIIAKVIANMTGGEEKFQYKSFSGKIDAVFRQFDTSHESIKATQELYTVYVKGIKEELDTLNSFLDEINQDELNEEDMRKLSHYEVMRNNLTLSKGRVEMSLESAGKLEETMKNSRAVFQTTLSACMLEVSSQATLDTGIAIINVMDNTISTLSDTLTESTIRTQQLSTGVLNKPLLAGANIEKNINLLEGAKETLIINK